MTPEQISLVQSSWQRAKPVLPVVVADFYERLFVAAPGVRALFPDDMTDQQRKLGAMLATVVSALRERDALVTTLSELGRGHVAYGAQAAHYPVVGSALLGALAAGLGSGWDADTEQAWAAAYAMVSEVMVRAAGEASEPAGV